MKKTGLVFLVIMITLMSFSKAQEKFRLKTYYDYSNKQLLAMLARAKTDTEKMILLNSLALDIGVTNSLQDIDTSSIKQIIKINGRAKLIDDAPYRTMLMAVKADKKGAYPEELSLCEQAVEELDKQNIDAGNFLIAMRWVFTVANKQEEKFEYYSKKRSFYLERGRYFNAAVCAHCIAGYYAFKGDYNSAINNYLKADDEFRPYSKTWYINEILVAGVNYNTWGNTNRALFYLKRGFRMVNERHTTVDLGFALISLSQAEYDIKHYKESLLYLDTLNSLNTKNDTSLRPSANIVKALDYTALNRFTDAYGALQTAKKYDDTSKITRVSTIGQYDLEYAFFKYYLAINELPAAEKYLLKAFHKSTSTTSTVLKLRYLKELAQFYGNQNKTADAWTYTVLYNRTNDSLQAKINGFKIAAYENEQKEGEQNKRLIEMQQQRAIQDATISQRNIIIGVSLAGLLLVCASLVFIYRQLNTNKRNLINLRKTQRQLIQSEKMASLGELTAGVAHEIQNPLNFVNNFSEVNIELITEMQTELESGTKEEVIEILEDIKQNLEKISHHGKRADGIVKGMLQHSRAGSNVKEPTDINKLADEYLRLTYHGLRAKDKSFNAGLITHFADKLTPVNVVPQDIGRALLNLFTNAFYAVHQKQKKGPAKYQPTVTLSTGISGQWVIIKVNDNGDGISENIRDKIMQPFFTTKPTGEGTGLGLSLSYEIVVNGHGGTIDIDSVDGEFTEFIIKLPI